MFSPDTPSSPELPFVAFWREFRLFRLPWLDTLFGRLPYLIALTLLPYLFLLCHYAAYLTSGFQADSPYRELSFWLWVLGGFKMWTLIACGLLAVAAAFLYWRAQIPMFFQHLYTSGRLKARHASLEEEYLTFLKQYQHALWTGRARFWWVALFCFLPIAYKITVPSLDMPTFVVMLIWAGLIGIAAAPLYVTGHYLQKLSQTFHLAIQPGHPDQCGGLRLIGDFCLHLVLPLLAGSGVLAILGIGGGLVWVNQGSGGWDANLPLFALPSEVLFANLGLVGVALPLTIASFFLPLWKIHQAMTVQKQQAEDLFATQIARLEQEIRLGLIEDENLEKLKLAQEKLTIVQAVHPDVIGYPVWPFPSRMLVTLVSPQILAIGVTLIEKVITLSS